MKKILCTTAFLLVIFILESAFRPDMSSAPPHLRDSVFVFPSPGKANAWVDSIFNTMDTEAKVAQLIFVRSYSKDNSSRIQHVKHLIEDEKIGGVTFFQGSPVRQAELTNEYQQISDVPLFISMDAEWGLGMRLDSILNLPRQMMLGAISDNNIIYEVGRKIGQQCKRIGVQINFAPDVDVNNNPNNPVINTRSFGENKFKVATKGIHIMHGMQSAGVIAVAKHFPGHGDTDVDSHKALPVISKSLEELKDLELYPFQQMINYGVKGIMIAHLEIPAIDDEPHHPMSISKKAVDGLLKRQMGFNGLCFTDALEMKGVSDYYKEGYAALEALKAGNDILLLPENVEAAIRVITEAVESGEVSMKRLNYSVKKVLLAKFHVGLSHWEPVETAHLTADLNRGIKGLNKELSVRAATVLNNENHILPFSSADEDSIAVLTVGGKLSDFTDRLQTYKSLPVIHFGKSESESAADRMAEKLKHNYQKIIIAVGPYHRYPAGNYGLSKSEIQLINQLQGETQTVVIAFGNPYAVKYFSHGSATVVAYNAVQTMQETIADLLFGSFDPEGTLPVSISEKLTEGTGLSDFSFQAAYLPTGNPEKLGINVPLLADVDSIAEDAIAKGGTPGCTILAMKDGKIFYHKAFGTMTYDRDQPVKKNTIYDLASVTKVMATTVACMRLYDEGKLKLDGTLGDYLPWMKGTDKADLTIKDVMLHQAGFKPDFWYGPYLKKKDEIFHQHRDDKYDVYVADGVYMRGDYLDSIKFLMRDSKLDKTPDYVYSDIDFELMGYIVKEITGLRLNEYVKSTLYDSLGMVSTG
ncbi:MAG TPA: glycoside hydrolase family 3 N-terminal domain-containing protein, partial [Chitinophagaceae bacterium]|nr:glycoside hydrolase family 3 N-terminal domain-containing protein [Chitinophagaceae bacterium]